MKRIVNLNLKPKTIKASATDFFIADHNNVIHQFVKGDKKRKFKLDFRWTDFDISCNFIAICYHKMPMLLCDLHDESVVRFDASAAQIMLAVRITPDETKIVTVSFLGLSCDVWNIATREICQSYKGHKEWVKSTIAFYTGGFGVFSTGDDKTVHLWDISNAMTIAKSSEFHRDILSIVSTTNLVAVSFHYSFEIVLLRAITLTRICSIKNDDIKIQSLAFSPDAQYLIFLVGEKNMSMWDTAAGAIITNRLECLKYANKACFSPDGRQLATISVNLEMTIHENFPLADFVYKNESIRYIKTVWSFFYNFVDDIPSSFNDNDRDNYFLMRILINMK